MATTTTTITNTGGIANSLNTPARADEDDVSVDCGTIGSSNDEEYIQVYRERILVGGSYFPPDNSESGSDRSEWNGMLHDISSLFPATKSETDSSSLFSRPNSNSIKAIFPPHRSIDDNGMQHDISSLFPATKSETDSSSLFSRLNSNSNSIMAIFPPHRSTDGSENDEKIIAQNPSISSYFPAYFSDTASLDRAYSAIQDAMYWPEDEFRLVLNQSTLRKSLWFSKYLLRLDDNASVDLIDPKAVVELRVFAARLIHSGFKKECIQVYSTVRREALDNCLVILGIEKLSIEEVQKIEWNSLDEKINKWIQAVKTVGSILSSEKSLCDRIFYGDDETKEICFNEIVKGCMMQLLNFGEAVAIGRRSPKKLFRILDMHDVMVEALARLKVLVTDDVVINKVRDVLFGLYEAACGTFIELENAVLSETSKKPMQSGEIHLLIRYVMNCVKKPTLRGEIHPLTWHMRRNYMKLIVMNYVKLIVDYSETLNFLLEIREDERGPSLDYNASVDLIDPKAVDELREITTTVIRSGFKKECIQFYNTARSDTLDECLVILGIEKLSIEEVQKIECNSLNEKMKKWIQAVKIVVRLILRVEKSLYDQIFCGANETKEICFKETVKGCVMQLLNFGEAVAIGGRSPEKLFRILGMYDVMADALKRLEVLGTDDVVINKARDVLSGLGKAACGTFAEFENVVQSENWKKPMQSGEIHPLTRYVMNYVKLIVDYSETLLLEIRKDEHGPSLDDNASVDLIDPKVVDELREITTTMIRSGFKKECIQFYSTVRSDALDECLVILGIEKLSIEEVQKIEWNSMNEKMKKWIQAMKIVVRLILTNEKSLCDQIFCGANETKEICFNETVKGCMMQLLNFGKADAIERRSHEKLFRILDMYNVMAEAMVRLEVLVTDDVVINEARDVLSRLSKAACGAFTEFENAIQSENWKKPMQSGEIHPLTWYMMNYVKLIVDYSETLLLEIPEDERGPSLDDNASVNLIDPKAVEKVREIVTTMIWSGFKKKCIQVYSTIRHNALDECLVILGIEKLSIEEVQKIEWNSLNEKMKKWIQAVKIVIRLILSSEKSLCDQIFCGKTKEICFNKTVEGCMMQLLNFGKAVAIGRRSPEKLFRILDMYDVMAEAMARLEVLVTDDVVINEARDVLSELGEAACGTFAEFENAVQSETLKEPMQSGEIHPLMRYVMDNVKLIVDYSDTLNFLLEIREDDDQLETLRNDDSDSLKLTPVARRLLVLITSLHSNLEEKSKLYEDGPLRYIFLMNNILYVVQKVKDSDLGGLFGNNWVCERRGQMRIYAWNYFWASWTKVSHCLKDDKIGGSSSNASRVALEEKIKNFNTYFEEIYRVQTAWKVPDAKLRKELRIFISKKVIPDYRSFMGRFGNQAESGRHIGNYMKYTADDLENYLLDLFEGSPRVLHEEKKYIG